MGTLMKKDFKIISSIVFLMVFVYLIVVPFYQLNLASEIEKDITEYEKTLQEISGQENSVQLKQNLEENLEYEIEYKKELIRENVVEWEDSIISLWILIFPVGIAVFLFGEERRKRTFDFLYAFPYTKKEIFTSKIIVGLIGLFIPTLTNTLSVILLRADEYIGQAFSTNELITSQLEIYIISALIYSIAVFFGNISGNTLFQIIFTYVALYFPIGISGLIAANIDVAFDNRFFTNFFDKHFYFLSKISPGVYPFENYIRDSGIKLCIIYLLAALIALLLSYLLFKKSSLERNKEVLLFQGSEGFFYLGTVSCITMTMGLIFYIMFLENMLALFAGYLVGLLGSIKTINYFILKNKNI